MEVGRYSERIHAQFKVYTNYIIAGVFFLFATGVILYTLQIITNSFVEEVADTGYIPPDSEAATPDTSSENKNLSHIHDYEQDWERGKGWGYRCVICKNFVEQLPV